MRHAMLAALALILMPPESHPSGTFRPPQAPDGERTRIDLDLATIDDSPGRDGFVPGEADAAGVGAEGLGEILISEGPQAGTDGPQGGRYPQDRRHLAGSSGPGNPSSEGLRQTPRATSPAQRRTPDEPSSSPDAAPAAPTAPTLSAASPYAVNLAWNPSRRGGTVTSYVVECSPDGKTGWKSVASVAQKGFRHGGVAPATASYYRVAAVGPGGQSPWSAVASITTRAASTLNGRTLLRPTDLTYLGAFDLPQYPSPGRSIMGGSGLALRRVEGEPRLFTTGGNCQVHELSVPALATGPEFNVAGVVNSWEDVYKSRAYVYDDGANGWLPNPNAGNRINGICWDEQDQRLYWNYGNGYSGNGTADPCFGFSTLGPAGSGTSSGYGPWRTAAFKRNEGGTLIIPSWFATTYLDGRRIGLGWGGYFSRIAIGDGSLGPALDAVHAPSARAHAPKVPGPKPPASPTDAGFPKVSQVSLMNYSGRSGPRDLAYEDRYPTLISSGTAQAGTSNSIKLRGTITDASPCWSRYFAGCRIELVSGTGAGQARTIIDHDNATEVSTVHADWKQIPDATTVYKVYRGGAKGNVSGATASGARAVVVGGLGSQQAGGPRDGLFKGFTLYISSGPGAGQGYPISAYTHDPRTGLGTFRLSRPLATKLADGAHVAVDGPRLKGTAAGGGGRSITLDRYADPIDGRLVNPSGPFFVKMLTGAAAGEERHISAYRGTTGVATLDVPWTIPPASGDDYLIRPAGFGGPLYAGYSRGYQGWTETYGGGVWIDTGTKHGVLYGANWAVGQQWYECSDRYCEFSKHVLQCFDPADLAAVAAGKKKPHAVDSAWDHDLHFPGLTYPIQFLGNAMNWGNPRSTSGGSTVPIVGMAFDPVASRLYICVGYVKSTPPEWAPRVFVYQVS